MASIRFERRYTVVLTVRVACEVEDDSLPLEPEVDEKLTWKLTEAIRDCIYEAEKVAPTFDLDADFEVDKITWEEDVEE